MSERRWVIMSIDEGVLLDMFKGHGLSEVVSDFPTDAKLIDIRRRPYIGRIELVIESSTFAAVPDGLVAPNWGPTLRSWRPADTLIEILEAERKR